MTPADLITQLRAGKSIADVAATKGVAVQKVIDALVARQRTARPDQSVADITTRLAAMVNNRHAPSATATA